MEERVFDRFGFDSEGYNKDGYNRMGYNREGYDRNGFNMMGINASGINKLTGRDKDGFDASGYNEAGFDKQGYDCNGYDINGFNANGYDRDGYDKDGYDRDGYDRLGLDVYGYDKGGFDGEGFDKNGYNRNGYDKSGRDKDGFDKDGYGIDGYNRSGYSREGLNRDGFDKEGFNREGYDLEGYNRKGYNKAGFNRAGFDKNGYDIHGYDKDGYNREGFNAHGFNRLGLNKNGYDKDGYDCDGYDVNGYDRDGLDKDGRDREGYDIYGFNLKLHTREGFDVWGNREDGFNILGLDKLGFDREGNNIDGFPKTMFDNDGYHIFTGYNSDGYNRDGYNINGVDKEGYGHDGYSVIDGFDRNGFDRDGYGKSGYNSIGFNREGYNASGFDLNGYDKNGYNKSGFDKKGYDKNGFDKWGYDINGYNKEGEHKPDNNIIGKQEIISDDKLEREYFLKCLSQIRGNYREVIYKRIEKEYPGYERKIIDRWGFVKYEQVGADYVKIEQETQKEVNRALREPYFAHIDYKKDSELYIGKRKINGWVVDWADERASIYYQYSIYVGNRDYDIQYVRDIIVDNGKYAGYKELYKKAGSRDDVIKVTDEHLRKIIESNRENKKVHDIVESIQQNQYKIITKDKHRNTLVLGCAGSGKTMILMHRIRYIKYNNPDFDMKNVVVISPTDILSRESKELSHLLQTGSIKQFTAASFYKKHIIEYLNKFGIEYEDFEVAEDGYYSIQHYDNSFIAEIKSKIQDIIQQSRVGRSLMDVAYKEFLNEENNYKEQLGNLNSEFSLLKGIFDKAVKEIIGISLKDAQRIIRQIDREYENKPKYEKYREVALYLKSSGCFHGKGIKRKFNKDADADKHEKKTSSGFYYTQKIIDSISIEKFTRINEVGKFIPKNYVEIVMYFQTISNETMEIEEIQHVLKEWSMLSEYDITYFLEYTEERLHDLECYIEKTNIIKLLISEKMIVGLSTEHDKLNAENVLNNFYLFYMKTKNYVDGDVLGGWRYFCKYNVLAARKKRILEQLKIRGSKKYIFDGIINILGVKYNQNQELNISVSEAYVCLEVLNEVLGEIDSKDKLIFIDEFQDFSPAELLLIKKLYKNCTINLYGDYKQCITEKGIDEEDKLPNILYADKEVIRENYRNASQITEYVKKHFNIDMMSIGLDGIVSESEDFPQIKIKSDDRVALIYEDNIKLDGLPYSINDYCLSGELKRGIINTIPVSRVKGLEFEKVIVLVKGMTDNQQYVAYTRAIGELYVVKKGDTKSNDQLNAEDRTQRNTRTTLTKESLLKMIEERQARLDEIKQVEETVDIDVASYFRNRGLKVVDNRNKGGALWVVGDSLEIGEFVDEAKEKFGIFDGAYTIGRSIGYNMGWYTRTTK